MHQVGNLWSFPGGSSGTKTSYPRVGILSLHHMSSNWFSRHRINQYETWSLHLLNIPPSKDRPYYQVESINQQPIVLILG